jgi:hypothetical protein
MDFRTRSEMDAGEDTSCNGNSKGPPALSDINDGDDDEDFATETCDQVDVAFMHDFDTGDGLHHTSPHHFRLRFFVIACNISCRHDVIESIIVIFVTTSPCSK